MPPSFDPSKPLAAIREDVAAVVRRSFDSWPFSDARIRGPPEHSSVPGPILVSANDEFIRHPLLVEIARPSAGRSTFGTGGSRSASARTCCRRVVKIEKIVVIEGRDRCGRCLDDRDLSLLCQVTGLTYLDLCPFGVSQATRIACASAIPPAVSAAQATTADGRRSLALRRQITRTAPSSSAG